MVLKKSVTTGEWQDAPHPFKSHCCISVVMGEGLHTVCYETDTLTADFLQTGHM